MVKIHRILLANTLSLVLIFILWAGAPSISYAEEMVTNDMLLKAIGNKAHDVMTEQMNRLRNILQGFLIGDWTTIQRSLDKMRYDVDRISSKYDSQIREKVPALMALEEIRKESQLLESYAQEKNYEQSYQSFVSITSQCIRCHQEQRTWGVFDQSKYKGYTSTPAAEEEAVQVQTVPAKPESAPEADTSSSEEASNGENEASDQPIVTILE